MKIYLSGPISGLTPSEYHENFEKAEEYIKANGHEPLSPLNVKACKEESCQKKPEYKESGEYLHSWECYLKYDLLAMLECEGIIMLPGWESSKGATLEHETAQKAGMMVFLMHENYKDELK